jgi:Asp-tRNA(Asn)/Glu-tRNA(Gln) amidotransferase A subunit family amidase
MLEDVQSRLKSYGSIHDLKIPNSVAPALDFNPVLPGMTFETSRRPIRLSKAGDVTVPKNLDDVAFYSVRQLAELVRRKKVSALDLTQMYLARLKRYHPTLHFVVTLTEDRALAQAKELDGEIAAGKYRGPLHGIPWGAKDLIAVKGYPTTWGAGGFEKQSFEEDATVVKRLDAAGAVLIAKLTLGALAMGDVWFGGMTRNPWKTDQGSSGSSAGSASATAAGCVAFGIGSETLGSISSPSTRCGATGLRPTFGRSPRTGAMALSWSMDKLGPLCRSVEDCAIVLGAIYGPDGHDRTVHDFAFNWDADLDIHKLRIGFLKDDFEHKAQPDEKSDDTARRIEAKKFDDDALDVLRTKLKIELIPVEMPKLPWGAMRPILMAEAAAAFDDLTRSGRDQLLTAQGKDDWPNSFRAARFIPAIEYVNGNRARMMGLQQMSDIFKKVDVIVAPTFSTQLLVTNLTGHPAVILPSGFREKDGTPVSLTFLGNLFGEASLLAVARAWEQATDFHNQHPKLTTESKG